MRRNVKKIRKNLASSKKKNPSLSIVSMNKTLYFVCSKQAQYESVVGLAALRPLPKLLQFKLSSWCSKH